MGQTEKYFTKFSYSATGAPKPACYRHVLSLGRKVFLIAIAFQQSSGKFFAIVKIASRQRVVYKRELDSSTRLKTIGARAGM
jgi:hypothetical protein